MARISRKSNRILSAPSQRQQNRRNLVGIYARLSVAYPSDKTRNSIQNQTELLKGFIEEHKEELCLVNIYSDSGVTGTSFERPGWNQMLEDIQARKIDCILVKDLSRIGRNYIETGTYLEQIFPSLGVRIISVSENYDSNNSSNYMLTNALTNLMNEFYARDIAKKTSAAKHALQKQGFCITGTPPYGYIKSDVERRRLVIDPETGCIVKQIFAWRLSGMGCSVIARNLNTLAVPSPGMYRYLNGNPSFQRCSREKWKSKHVAEILKNPAYLGHMVQGKTKSSYFEQDGKQISLPKEQWIIVKHTQEPLVTQEQFSTAAQMAEQSRIRHQEQLKRNETIPHTEQPLRRKIICGQCGYPMTRRNKVKNGVRDYFYYCASSRTKLASRCTGTYVHEIPLLEAVLAEAAQHAGRALSLDMLDMLIEKIIIISSREWTIFYTK